MRKPTTWFALGAVILLAAACGDDGGAPPGADASVLPDGAAPGPDAAPACDQPGQMMCGAVCADTLTDESYCGDCLTVCGPNQVCTTGVCACDAPFITCGMECINPGTDPANCGGCVAEGNGDQCLIGVECISGVCQPCGFTVCGDECADLATNERHCGGCGLDCVPGATCTSGMCTCPAAQPNECPTGCTDFMDTLNCGACGNECAPGAVCTTEGTGTPHCACPDAAQVMCPDGCTLTATDNANCGACGNVCTDGSTCTSGACVCPIVGEIFCGGGGCVDAANDVDNCGGCGNQCPVGGSCVSGLCTCPAATPDVCGGGRGVCVDQLTDGDHCGGCGNNCVDGLESCVSGTCGGDLAMCDPGVVFCPAIAASGTACRDILSDPNDCGATCGAAEGNNCNSDEYCSGGACVCRPELEECPGIGCTDTATDPLNCGGCGTLCAGMTPRCEGGGCVATCSPGLTNCGFGATCIDTDRDPRHCGGCGNDCAEDEVCVSGECRQYRPTGDCTTCPCDRCFETFGGDASCCAHGTDPICVDANTCP